MELIRPEVTIIPRRIPETEEEKKSYWYKAYQSMEEAALKTQARNDDLEKLLAEYDRGFGAVRGKMENQDQLIESELGNHNDEMRKMAEEMGELHAEVARLKAKVRELGGT